MARLSGKSAVVTGGASGIGKAIAQLFLEEGAQNVIADINGALLEKTAKEFAGLGPVSSIVADGRAIADAGRILAQAVDRHGARGSLVCNACSTSPVPRSHRRRATRD